LTRAPFQLFFARMQLLTTNNTKIRKGEKIGFMSFGLHLAPANMSGTNVCSHASAGCIAACLNTAGRGAMSPVQNARIAKTKLFSSETQVFMAQLKKEIATAIKKAIKKNFTPCFRLNLTSDLPWESIKIDGKSLMETFPDVQFYDYTKNPSRMGKFCERLLPSNYHLTFSRSECNDVVVQAVMQSGGNVAAVFRGALPATWNGKRVVNGDETDLRFLDPLNSVVGLVQKGKAKKDASGFVIA